MLEKETHNALSLYLPWSKQRNIQEWIVLVQWLDSEMVETRDFDTKRSWDIVFNGWCWRSLSSASRSSCNHSYSHKFSWEDTTFYVLSILLVIVGQYTFLTHFLMKESSLIMNEWIMFLCLFLFLTPEHCHTPLASCFERKIIYLCWVKKCLDNLPFSGCERIKKLYWEKIFLQNTTRSMRSSRCTYGGDS